MAFNGEIKGINLPDIIQMVCLEGTDRVMTIVSNRDVARVYFSNGEIVHAVTKEKKGVEAFFEIMAWNSGNFELVPGQTQEKSIEMPWNFLLIESQRQVDERRSKDTEGAIEGEALKVLLVDDSRVALNSLKKVIHRISPGHTILEARNGKEALEVMRQERPDFVCLDASMPVMDGDVTLMHIMVRSPAPVALVSGLDQSKAEEIMDFFRLGAVDFLKKPGPEEDWKEIETRLARLIRLASQLKVQQVRRARRPRIPASKAVENIRPKGLVVIIGGLGGILELQKMLVSVEGPHLRGLAFVVIQDMSKALVDPLCLYLDRHTALRAMPLSNGQRLLAGGLYVSNWDFCWDLKDARFRRFLMGKHGQDAINAFLKTCAGEFQDQLMLLILTGTDLDLEEGLQEVVARSGHLLLQSPKTCLYPRPLLNIEALDVDEGHFESEGFHMVLQKFFPF